MKLSGFLIINKVIFWVPVTILVVLSSFSIGVIFRISSIPKNMEAVIVKNFTAPIQKTVVNGLKLKTGKEIIQISSEELKKWIEPYHRDYSGENDLRLSISSIEDYLNSLAPQINTNPVDAKLTFENDKISESVPSIDGQKLNIGKSAQDIIKAADASADLAELAVDKVEPEITIEKIHDLGIVALIGRGESSFGKSHASRINNIKVGSAHYQGIIIKPGEEFSFNKILGDVEEKDGYRAELVIKNGELVKEYGGGLCQISTTIFRAAILAGLPIKERRPHFFAVSYYNPQGFDATIYPGISDLRFVNDTPSHILLQTKVVNNKLFAEIYGSKDGREVKIEGPVQYDQKPNGSLKARLTRKIYRDNILTKEEKFDSNYKPPPKSPLERNPLE